MKQQTLDSVRHALHTTEDYLRKVQVIYERFNHECAKLDSAESKAKFTPRHLTERRHELSKLAFEEISPLGTSTAEIVKPILKARDFWTLGAFLKRQRFVKINKAEAGQTNVLLADLIEELKHDRVERRAQTLSDEQFLEELGHLVETEDFAALSIFAEASERRDSAVRVRMKQALERVRVPELDEAQGLIQKLDAAAVEIIDMARLIQNPDGPDAATLTSLISYRQKKAVQQKESAAA